MILRICWMFFLMFSILFGSSVFNPKPLPPDKQERLDRTKAIMQLRSQDPEVKIRFDETTGCVATIDGDVTSPSNRDPLEITLDFMEEYSSLFRIENPREEFVVASEKSDDFGKIHLKLNQVWKQIPVWGAQIGVHLNSDGSIYYINGGYYPSPDIEVKHSLTEEQGVNSAVQHYTDLGGSPVKSSDAELMIYPVDGKEFKVAWHITIQGENIMDGWEYFVDANTGEILYRITTIRYDGPVEGSGTDSHGSVRTLHLYQMGSEYYLIDATKPMFSPPVDDLNGVIGTYDFGHTTESFSLITSTSTTVGDVAAVDLHYVFSEIYDFYYEIVERNSWNNSGITIRPCCHFAENYNNAFWAGAENNIFVFGDGDGEHFSVLTGGFDVCCHEFQHAVTEGSANLIYHNQPGALNEAYSDIAASVFDPDWEIGEDIYTPSISGDALRYMDNPTRADLPAHMRDFRYLPDTEEGDWGGVHINMSIPSLAFVNMVDDDPHFSRDDAFKVWYRALAVYLTNSSDFADGRDGVLRAAEDIYGDEANWDDIECGIQNAFYSVGIGEECGGGGGGEYEGEYLYYWNDDASEYYTLYLPELDPDYEAYGYGVRFTVPSGDYRVASVYFFLADVWTLYDMYIGLYDESLSEVASVTIPNDDLWYAVYGDTMSFPLVGLNWESDYSGDFYAFCWLEGTPLYDDYVALVVDNGTGSSEERNYYLCLLYTSPSPRDLSTSRMPSSA